MSEQLMVYEIGDVCADGHGKYETFLIRIY